MPTPIQGFACDLCKAIHQTELAAAICEEQHGTAEVMLFEYEPGKRGPSAVVVRLTDANGANQDVHYY
jgi:hypothetical protein